MCKIALLNSPHRIVKIPDFGRFISLDGMNSDFLFNKYQKHFIILAAGFRRKNLAFARKIMPPAVFGWQVTLCDPIWQVTL